MRHTYLSISPDDEDVDDAAADAAGTEDELWRDDDED